MTAPASAASPKLNTQMLALGYPSVCVLTFLRLARQLGVELGDSLGNLTEAELETGRLTVPWSDTLTFFDILVARLNEDQQHEMVRQYMTTMPFFRAVTPFMASVTSFLTLVWRGSRGVTQTLDSRYEVRPTEHELFINFDELGLDAEGILHISGLIAIYGPLAMGAPSLTPLSWECTARRLHMRLSAPIELSSEKRRGVATNATVTSILQTLEMLGPAAPGALRDGHLILPNQAAHDVLELVEAWGVTPTEARVALALAEGRSPSEVGIELNITVATVRVHLKHLYAKTDTSNQRELVERLRAWRET